MALTGASIVMGIFLLLSNPFISAASEFKWEVSFDENVKEMVVGEVQDFQLSFKTFNTSELKGYQSFYIKSTDYMIAHVFEVIHLDDIVKNSWRMNFTINPMRPGSAKIFVDTLDNFVNGIKRENNSVSMKFIVHRNLKSLESKNALIYLDALSISILLVLNVCFGASLDIRKINAIFRKPAGIILAFALDFIILPLVSVYFTQSHIKIVHFHIFISISK